MNPEIIAALSKAIKAEELSAAREQLEGQTVAINTTVKIKLQGELKVGKSCTTQQVNKLCPWKLLAVAMNKMNEATIQSIVRQAMDMSTDDAKPIKEKTMAAITELAGTTEQKRAGAIKWSGIAEVK